MPARAKASAPPMLYELTHTCPLDGWTWWTSQSAPTAGTTGSPTDTHAAAILARREPGVLAYTTDDGTGTVALRREDLTADGQDAWTCAACPAVEWAPRGKAPPEVVATAVQAAILHGFAAEGGWFRTDMGWVYGALPEPADTANSVRDMVNFKMQVTGAHLAVVVRALRMRLEAWEPAQCMSPEDMLAITSIRRSHVVPIERIKAQACRVLPSLVRAEINELRNLPFACPEIGLETRDDYAAYWRRTHGLVLSAGYAFAAVTIGSLDELTYPTCCLLAAGEPTRIALNSADAASILEGFVESLTSISFAGGACIQGDAAAAAATVAAEGSLYVDDGTSDAQAPPVHDTEPARPGRACRIIQQRTIFDDAPRRPKRRCAAPKDTPEAVRIRTDEAASSISAATDSSFAPHSMVSSQAMDTATTAADAVDSAAEKPPGGDGQREATALRQGRTAHKRSRKPRPVPLPSWEPASLLLAKSAYAAAMIDNAAVLKLGPAADAARRNAVSLSSIVGTRSPRHGDAP